MERRTFRRVVRSVERIFENADLTLFVLFSFSSALLVPFAL